eukprot:TRINITY_DN55071_c0_g1_i1.p1 TRINITY_DN55071_c0_g1~~TRINITY_DN55071_c0_g1_i1.p1  ORF type:complete len:203 (-),score=11.79 TRINITY_DN55071_c0_g1_i1:189-797(-)
MSGSRSSHFSLPEYQPVSLQVLEAPFTDEDLGFVCALYNDMDMKYLHRELEKPGDEYTLDTLEELRTGRCRLARENGRTTFFLILHEGKPVGECSVLFGQPWVLGTDKDNTAFIGIVIAKEHHRKGIGQKAMQLLEAFCSNQLGATRMELGVFEHNTIAMGMYGKLGYSAFDKYPDLTWWQGKCWPAIHMEKHLQAPVDKEN